MGGVLAFRHVIRHFLWIPSINQPQGLDAVILILIFINVEFINKGLSANLSLNCMYVQYLYGYIQYI